MKNQSLNKTAEQRLDDFAEFLMTHEFDTAEADESLAQGASIYYIEPDTVFVKVVVTVFCLKQLVASSSLFQGST